MNPILPIPRAEAYLAELRARLPAKTVRHVESVAALAMDVAGRVGVSVAAAGTAGLLHDLCKAVPNAEQLALAERHGLAVSETQRRNPKLLHGHTAAEEARRLFGVEDEEVLEAIRWHTTGRPGLGLTGQVLYFADFSEPLRPYPEAAQARALLDAAGFEPAIRWVAECKLEHARRKPALDPHTPAFLDWLRGERAVGRE
jgi:predicted HD superfamily hydrolase involved in NAD metabolism